MSEIVKTTLFHDLSSAKSARNDKFSEIRDFKLPLIELLIDVNKVLKQLGQ